MNIHTKVFCISVLVILSSLIGRNALASSSDFPSEAEMRRFLLVNSELEYSCTVGPLHFIDLKAKGHSIQAVAHDVLGGFQTRAMTLDENRFIVGVVTKTSAFVVTQVDNYMLTFVPLPQATTLEILESAYTIKKALDDSGQGLFINSQAPCGGTVSVGN